MLGLKIKNLIVYLMCAFAITVNLLTIPYVTGKYYSILDDIAIEIDFNMQFPAGMDNQDKITAKKLFEILNDDTARETLDGVIRDGGGGFFNPTYVGDMYEGASEKLTALFGEEIIGYSNAFIIKREDLIDNGGSWLNPVREYAIYSTADILDYAGNDTSTTESNTVCVFVSIFVLNADTNKYEMYESIRGYAKERVYANGTEQYSFDTDTWRDSVTGYTHETSLNLKYEQYCNLAPSGNAVSYYIQ